MKKLLTTTAMAMVSLGVLAQGTANFSTVGGGANAPATNRLTMARVTGTDFTAQLFYDDPRVTTDNVNSGTDIAPSPTYLTPVAGTANFASGSFAGYINSASGGGTRTLQGVAGGATATLQVRAWSTALGADYATAYQNWLGGAGVLGASGIGTITTGDPTLGTLPTTFLGANPGYFLNPVPEPSTIALGILGGLGTLLLIRRRK